MNTYKEVHHIGTGFQHVSYFWNLPFASVRQCKFVMDKADIPEDEWMAKRYQWTVSIPDFRADLPDFPAKYTKFFRKHSKVRKNILSHSRSEGSNLGRRTIQSYKRSYLFLSYGDLAAFELRKAAKTSLQVALQFIPYFSAKCLQGGENRDQNL